MFGIKLSKKILAASSLLIVMGCSEAYMMGNAKNADPIDRVNDLTRKDYKDKLIPQPKPEIKFETKAPPVPKTADILINPPKPKLGINKTVTLSVTEDVPLKDVFIELARLADVDIEVDSAITGGVIFKAKNKPFDDVVDRICEMAGLRYSVNNGILKIETDKPYMENYPVDFLNLVRSNSGDISINTGVLSGAGGSSGGGGGGAAAGGGGGAAAGGGGGGGGSGLTSGSSTSVSSEYDGDLWKSIEADVKTLSDIADTSTSPARNGKFFVSSNKQANMLTVMTTAKNHARIKQYLDKIKEVYSAQVLIEAKVVEVELNDQYKTGVNWAMISGNAAKKGFNIGMNASQGDATSDSSISPIYKIAGGTDGGDITGAVQLAQAFGVTRTLSSPRVLTLNNQQAVLTFAKNQVYFKLDVTKESASSVDGVASAGQLTVKSTLNTVPIGLILTLQPSIDVKNNEIMMNVRPTLSTLVSFVDDPAVQFLLNSSTNKNLAVDSKVPVVQVREMDSVLKLRNKEIMVIGGMIEQKMDNQDLGVPYVDSIPVVGNAFKKVDKTVSSVQTVIFLQATIVPGHGVDKSDQDFYRTFNNDPHPAEF